jgi:uncharacterized membrane protein YdjX (TVP38/TMEM64 family)
MKTGMMKIKKRLLMPSLSAFFLTILPFLTSSLIGVWMVQNEGLIKGFEIKEWAIVCFVCSVACALALIPPTLLAFGFGYFLGWQAVIPLILLNLAAISIVYFIVNQLDKARLLTYLSQFERVASLLNRIHADEIRFVFFTKLSPVLPFALTNLVFSLMGIKFKNVILGGFLGMIPRTVLAVWVGKEAQEISRLIQNPNESLTSKIVIIALVILSVGGLLRILVKK